MVRFQQKTNKITGQGMDQILNSKAYQFEYLGEGKGFNLNPQSAGYLRLENCQVRCRYDLNGQPCEDDLTGLFDSHLTYKTEASRIGLLNTLVVEGKSRGQAVISYCLSFALLDEAPLFLWKMELFNHSAQDVIEIDRFEMLRIGNDDINGQITIPPQQKQDLAFFSNGWQSWSHTAVYGANEKQKISRLGPFSEPMNCNSGTPVPKKRGHFTSDFYGVVGDRKSKWGLLLGFLSQKEQFGTIEAIIKDKFLLKLWANGDRAQILPGKSMQTDWAIISHIDLASADPLAFYLDLVAKENEARVPERIYTGWCSWYQYYTRITPEIVTQNLEMIAKNLEKLPVDAVQVDDGFESQVGDWLTFKPQFSEGMAGLAKKIKDKNLIPGIWLAPFILHPKAEICKQHPEWVLKDRYGRAVNAGFVWNTFTQALDITRPEVMAYICEVIKTAVFKWGYPYLKLDFLYAAALPGRHADVTLTRAQILHKGMEMIREAMGEQSFLLGCGAPLGSMLGLVDAMRIGCDVAGEWAPEFNGISFFFKAEPFMPSARNAIQNIITRIPLHRRWWINDPDCLLVRPDTKLSLDEVKTLTTAIGMSGGMMLLSDNMEALNPERLRLAQVLLPLIGTRPQVVDWFDRLTPQKLKQKFTGPSGTWQVLAWFNWAEYSVETQLNLSDFNLDEGNYMVRSFWGGELRYSSSDRPLWQQIVPPHGVLLLAVRIFDSKSPLYLGSDIHISQGQEVTAWEPSMDRLRLALNTKIDGIIDLYLPFAVKTVEIEGDGPVSWQKNTENGIRLDIKAAYNGKIIVVKTK
jgi:alpha-galactosidase